MLKEKESNKKIDFKEKALKAKEGAIKKIVANAHKVAKGQENGPQNG